MKRILLFFTLLVFAFQVEGQSIIRANAYHRAVGSGYCAEYQVVYNAMTNKPAADTAGYQNAMVFSLDSLGVWSEFDVFYVFANGSNGASESLINWQTPGTNNATNPDALTWTKNEGILGDDAHYLLSNYNPLTEGVKYLLDDAALGIYLRVDEADGANPVMGITNGVDITSMIVHYSSNMSCRINTTGAAVTAASTNAQGFFVISRSDNANINLYRNGTDLGSPAQASVAIPNANMNLLGRAGSYSVNQVAIAFAGGGLTDDQVTKTNTILERYMDRLGKGVQ